MKPFNFSKLGTVAFYTALSIEIAMAVLDRSAYIIQYPGWWFRITFCLFAVKILTTKYIPKQIAFIGAFVLLGAISYFITGNNNILRVVVMIAACKGIDSGKAFKTAAAIMTVGTITCIALSFVGIGLFSLTKDFGRGVDETRYCLGLGHPNTLHGMLWMTCLYLVYALRDRIKIISLILLMIMNFVAFWLTNSRTGLIVTAFLIITEAMLLMNRWIPDRLVHIGITMLNIALLPYVCLVMDRRLYYPYVAKFDSAITGRVLSTFRASRVTELTSWLPFSAMGREPMSDIGIAKIVGTYGYIPLLIFILLMLSLLHALYAEKDYAGMAVMASIVLSLYAEAHVISDYIGSNPIILLAGIYWDKMVKTEETDYYMHELIMQKQV